MRIQGIELRICEIMGWLALDDTDSLDGGCTTYTFDQILRELNQLSVTGSPWSISSDERLVRLWPFAARRTRGNASVSARMIVHESGEDLFLKTLGLLFEKYVQKPTNSVPTSHHSNRTQYPASPVLIWFKKKPSEINYWRAVSSEVDLNSVITDLEQDQNAIIWSHGELHGAIGAQAAASWNGTELCTWELTAYRSKSMFGLPRIVPQIIVEEMDSKFEKTFLNRDPTKEKSFIAPRSNCPVLYGIRSRDSLSSESAHLWMQSRDGIEKSSHYRIWRTNQATDDHLTGKWRGHVISPPAVLEKGHASVVIEGRFITDSMNFVDEIESDRIIAIVAFAQGGFVNSLLREMHVGDEIECMGLISPNGEVHAEKIRIINPILRNRKRPLCECGRRMKKMGKNQGIRCSSCKKTMPDSWIGEKFIQPLQAYQGWVQPSIDSRRHLASPLEQ